MVRKSKGPHPFKVSITRYVNRRGKRCAKGTPGAKKVVVRSETYYVDFPLPGGKRDRVSLQTDNLQLAWERLRLEQKRRHEEELGIRDRFTEAAEVPLSKHLEEWLATVEASGTTGKQLKALRNGVETLAEVAGWKRITDIDHDSAVLALAAIQKPGPGRPKGRSAQTRNHYRSHLRQFTAWAFAGGRLRADPLGRLERVDVSTDRRHDRRTPTDEEVARLFEALEKPDAVTLEGMSGPQRALGYRVAMATGLRANELRSLTWRNFDLEAGVAVLAAAYSKRRREDRIALPSWLVAMLRAWQEASGGLWEGFPAHHPGKVLQLDLAAAGVPYRTTSAAGNPLFFDFHSLRHYFCTLASHVAGISPRTLLALTRHSTVELAMGVYGTAQAGEVAAAVQQIRQPGKRD